jgi:hypothetical protein
MAIGRSLAEAKPRSFAPAELIDVREVPEGVEYVVLNRSCRLTAFLDRRKSRLQAKGGDQIQYAAQGKYLYLTDAAGKVHKLRYVLQELMPPPPPPVR